MTDYAGKFLPVPRPQTAVWWEHCKAHKLMIQQCTDCGAFQFYPRIVCTSCMSSQVELIQSAGRGEVVTFSICRVPVAKAYAEDVPYVVALIRLDEGPVMMSNVIGCEAESVESGMAVEVVFQEWSDSITMPVFKPLLNDE